MTVNSATIGADWFLNGLAELQTRELQTQQQLAAGFSVSSAADDPGRHNRFGGSWLLADSGAGISIQSR